MGIAQAHVRLDQLRIYPPGAETRQPRRELSMKRRARPCDWLRSRSKKYRYDWCPLHPKADICRTMR